PGRRRRRPRPAAGGGAGRRDDRPAARPRPRGRDVDRGAELAGCRPVELEARGEPGGVPAGRRRRRLPRTRVVQRPIRDGMTVTLLVTDQDLNIVGDPLDGWTNLDCTKRFNEPGSGTVDLPAA